MDNISFGAHLSLQNNSLYKHISFRTASEFAKRTKDIPGIMTLKKGKNRTIEVILNNQKHNKLILHTDTFYKINGDKKLNILKKMAKYINAVIKFEKRDYNALNEASEKMIKRQAKRLDKIVGNETSFLETHLKQRNELLSRLSE